MKNKSSGKKIGTIISVIAALAVAIVFWLVVKYIDSGAYSLVENASDIGNAAEN